MIPPAVTWFLSWPWVTTNNLYRRRYSGQVHLSDRARAWRDEVIVTVRQSGLCLPDGSLEVTIGLYAPKVNTCDVDGPVKLTLDSVFAAFDDDDRRVGVLHVYRWIVASGPYIVVTVQAERPRNPLAGDGALLVQQALAVEAGIPPAG